MGATQGVYGMIDGDGNGGEMELAAGAATYLYHDVSPIGWETARIEVKQTAPYGGAAPGDLEYSVEMSHDNSTWNPITFRNLTEVYDGVTDNAMAADTIQVSAITISGAAQEVPIGLREPAPYTRLKVSNGGATTAVIECHMLTMAG